MKIRIHIKVFTALAFIFSLCSCNDVIDWNFDPNHENSMPYGAKSLFEKLPKNRTRKFEILVDSNNLSKKLPKYLRDSVDKLSDKEIRFFASSEIDSFDLFMVKDHISLSKSDLYVLDMAVQHGANVLLSGESFSQSILDFWDISLVSKSLLQIPDTALLKVPTTQLSSETMRLSKSQMRVRTGILNCELKINPLVKAEDLENEFTEPDEQETEDTSVVYDEDSITEIVEDVEDISERYTWFYYTALKNEKTGAVYAYEFRKGKGKLIICSTPRLFTNISFLYQNPELVQEFYQTNTKGKLLWGNEYYSYDQFFENNNESLLKFINKYKSLKTAWYLALFGAILYILLNIRRLQAVFIPLSPKVNLSLMYIDTITKIYRSYVNHGEMLVKKYELTERKIFERYGISKNLSPEEKAQKIISKTGKKDQISELTGFFSRMDKNKINPKLGVKDYIKQFRDIDNFKKEYL